MKIGRGFQGKALHFGSRFCSFQLVCLFLVEIKWTVKRLLSLSCATDAIGEKIILEEKKPASRNQQCVACNFKYNWCDADYIVHTIRHLYQRIEEQKVTAIGKHLKEQDGNVIETS